MALRPGYRALAVMVLASGLEACQPAPEEASPVSSAPWEMAEMAAESGPSQTQEISAFRNLETMEFEEFESKVYKVPGAHELYVVNGDVPILGRRNLEEFFKRAKGDVAGVARGKLLLNRLGAMNAGVSGRPDLWDPESRKSLTYCISDSFGVAHERVVSGMQAAASDWERYADVKFRHATGADAHCVPSDGDVLFAVTPASLDTGVLAIAPFPHFPRHERLLRLNDTYFEPDGDHGISLEGLLRHELGHVLGFDHEQNRPEAGSCFMADDNFAVTPFDPRSVMMYPECQRRAEFSGFQLSELDKRGAGCVYGPGPDSLRDDPDCRYRAATSNATGRQVTTEWSEQTVSQGTWRYYDPLKAKPGSMVAVTMRRDRSNGSDPDLYLRFLDRPSSREFDCGPRLDVDEETCRVRIPDRTDGGATASIYIGVRGVSDSTYALEVIHVAAEQRD